LTGLSLSQLGVVSLAIYLLALLAVAEIAKRARKDASPSDHFLASRELGLFVLFLTLYATAYSGNSLLGYPGRAYRSGFSFIMATGFMLAIIVAFHALAPKLRRASELHDFVTPGDWIRHRFAGQPGMRPLLLCVGTLMSIAMLNFLLAQLKAMGLVTSTVTGDTIPYWLGVVGIALVILVYETRGGMRAVAWTDAVQGILMVLGLGALLAWLLGEAGGLGAITRAVAQARPEAVAVPDAITKANWFSTIALLGLGSVVYPQAIQRIYAAKSARVLARSFALMTFMPFVTTLVVTLIGLAAIAYVGPLSGTDSDEVMPILLVRWGESGGAVAALASVVVFLGALAAIMSTADSCLLSLGALVARDLLGGSDTADRTTRRGKLIAAVLLLAMIPIALNGDITLWRLIELKMELLVQCSPAFLLALHWRRLSASAALAGLVVGTAFSVGLTLAGQGTLLGVHVGIVGVALNVSIAVMASLWAKPGVASPATEWTG
jgi:Na+/proline symporter